MTLIYLHGFNSDGEGFKYEHLCRFFPEAYVIAPDLEADPGQVVAQVEQLAAGLAPPLYLLGSSLGGFYALYFSARLQVPCFLYNPSLQPHLTLHRGIGRHQTFIKGRDYHFKAEYLPVLGRLKSAMVPQIREQQLNFFLATDDEVLDLRPIPGLFPGANHLSWHQEVGHGFSGFKATLPTVRRLIEAYETLQN